MARHAQRVLAPTLEEIDIELDRRACERSLSEFVKRAWHVVEPGQPYKHGWHIDAVCDHLTAVSTGDIIRLIINVPPGTMKSLASGVFWPAWEWGPRRMPHLRFLGTSYKEGLAIRDNLRTRRLITSDWYRRRWGDNFSLVGDQNQKTKFENDQTGFREAMAFTSLTGSRGDRVLLDDPLSVDNANSDVQRDHANEIFREALPTRLNNPDSSAIVVIMQRLHEDDVTGMILAHEWEYEHLMLPMEFEPERKCYTSIGFEDPRTEDGELLFPDRFPRHVVDRDKAVLGSYATAGQLQQRPTAREGGLFKRAWFTDRFIRQAPAGTRWVRHWDLAATKGQDAARSAGVKLGVTPDDEFVVGHVVKTQDEGPAVRKLIKTTAEMDGKDVEISLPQDPGQAGKVQAKDMVKYLAGYIVRATGETGDKYTRAEPFSVQCEAGNVYIVTGDWNEDYLDELCMFPMGKFADQVDASSGAFARLLQMADRFEWYVGN